jgi:hypothetical protein
LPLEHENVTPPRGTAAGISETAAEFGGALVTLLRRVRTGSESEAQPDLEPDGEVRGAAADEIPRAAGVDC